MLRNSSQVHPMEEEEADEDVSSDEYSSESELSESYNEDSDDHLTDSEDDQNEWYYELLQEKAKKETRLTEDFVNDTSPIRELTEKVQDVNEYIDESEYNKRNALHAVAGGVNAQLFDKILLSNKDKVNEQNKKKKTPLHIAAKHNREEITQILIDNGADITLKDSKFFTPLHTAVRYDCLEVYNLLKKKLQDDNPVENDKFLSKTVREEKEHTMVDTLERKDKLIQLNPLQIAAKYNCHKVAKKLIDEDPNWIYCTDETKRNIVYFATKNKSDRVLKLLLEKAKNDTRLTEDFVNGTLPIRELTELHEVQEPESSPSESESELHEVQEPESSPSESESKLSEDEESENLQSESKSEENQRKDIPRRMFRLKSPPKQLPEDKVREHSSSKSELQEHGNSHQESEWSEDQDCVNSQSEYKEKSEVRSKIFESDTNTPILVAAQKGYIACLEHLIKYKADLFKTCKNGKTALHIAAENGRIGIVEKLNKAAPRLKHTRDDKTRTNRTALHYAINHLKVVEVLINLGAKVNKKDKDGRTPVSYAAEKGKLECTIKLIENGADINLADVTKMRPIHYAAKEGHSEVFKALATKKHIKPGQSNWNCLELAIDNDHEETAFTIFQIEKDNWQEMLQSRSKHDNCVNPDEYHDTPMRKLIRKMPNVAKEVFNHCTEIRNDKNKPFQVTFNYEFLNDTYDLHTWRIHTNESKDSADDKDDKISAHVDKCNETTNDNKQKSNKTKPKAYTENETFIIDNHPLMLMVNLKRTELVNHPLVSALLKSKWMNIGVKLTILNILLYAVFLGLLTRYVLELRAPYLYDNSSNAHLECPDFTEERNHDFVSFAQYGIVFLAIIELFIEVLEIAEMFKGKVWIYILEIENFLEWITCITAIIFVVTTPACKVGLRPDWQWSFGTVSVFLAWINMLFIIRKFDWFGIYVVMLYRIIKVFLKFFFVFFLLMVAFAISFHCLFQNQENYSSFWISLMKTSSMMIGGPDFTSIFLDETVHYENISYVMFYIFMWLMAIVVINLLIGLAVNNIQEFQEDADFAKRKMQVKFILELERIATSSSIFNKFVNTSLCLEKQETLKPNDQGKVQKTICESWKLTEQHIRAGMSDEKDSASKVGILLDTKLKDLAANFETHMKYMETKIKAIEDKLESKGKETSNVDKCVQ